METLTNEATIDLHQFISEHEADRILIYENDAEVNRLIQEVQGRARLLNRIQHTGNYKYLPRWQYFKKN